jgi:hypothetical protein
MFVYVIECMVGMSCLCCIACSFYCIGCDVLLFTFLSFADVFKCNTRFTRSVRAALANIGECAALKSRSQFVAWFRDVYVSYVSDVLLRSMPRGGDGAVEDAVEGITNIDIRDLRHILRGCVCNVVFCAVPRPNQFFVFAL